MARITRRHFLIAGAALGGVLGAGLLVGGGYLASLDIDGLAVPKSNGATGPVALNGWIEVSPDGTIRLAVPHLEMGQGVQTGLAMLAAEELAVPVERIVVHHPTEPQPFFSNFAVTLQKRPEDLNGPIDWISQRIIGAMELILTGGSTATINAFVPMRRAGAAARMLLEEAGARRFGTDRTNVRAENGFIVDTRNGQKLSYAELAADAARLPLPVPIVLKPASDWTIIGRDTPRLDVPSKVDGTAVYGIDVRLPGMLFARLAMPETFGGKLRSMDRAAAEAVPGVVKVLELPSGIAVVAEHTWAAMAGVEALKAAFEPMTPAVSSETISKQMRDAADSDDGHVFRAEGDVAAAMTGSIVKAVYETPYLAHAMMEPPSAAAQVVGKTVKIWSGAQTTLGMAAAAKDAGLTAECNIVQAGGGFGRRAEKDVIGQAVELATKLEGKPVLVTWSREDDMRHAPLRPAAVARCEAAVDANGMPTALDLKIGTQSVTKSYSARNMPFTVGGDGDSANAEGAVHLPYTIANVQVAASHVDTPAPVGFWRSVGHSNTAFFVESFLDELAARAKRDPIDYRLALLENDPRLTKVLEQLKAFAQWTGPQAADGRGRGMALHGSFQSVVGLVVDIAVAPDKAVKVERVACVVDCGLAVNPQQVKAQMEGGILFALSAAMTGEVPIERNAVTVSNFHDYPMALLKDAPVIETLILASDAPPGGIGEPATPPLFPALANAVFAATGDRVRTLPLAKAGYRFA